MNKPRILLLSSYYHPVVGGSETHARQIATCLHQHGFEVTVLTKRVGRELAARDMVDGIPVVRIRPSGQRAASQKWLMVPVAFLAMLGMRGRFDLVFSPDYRAVGLAGILAAKLLGKRSVMCTQALGVLPATNADSALARVGLSSTGLIGRALKWPLRRVYGAADAYAVITRAIEREAIDFGISAGRIHYLPNSVDVRRFRPPTEGERGQIRREEGWPADRTICLFMARLSLEKGLMDLLEAWRGMADVDALLMVVGPDMTGHSFDVGPSARAFVKAHDMESRVRFLGPSRTPERMLRAADVHVQPSHWEAAPFGVVEAMATRLPVVATRVGGMAEYLVDGVNALLSEPKDPEGLARQLRRALTDPALRDALGTEARRTAEREFDERVMCERYARLFGALAGERTRRPDPISS